MYTPHTARPLPFSHVLALIAIVAAVAVAIVATGHAWADAEDADGTYTDEAAVATVDEEFGTVVEDGDSISERDADADAPDAGAAEGDSIEPAAVHEPNELDAAAGASVDDDSSKLMPGQGGAVDEEGQSALEPDEVDLEQGVHAADPSEPAEGTFAPEADLAGIDVAAALIYLENPVLAVGQTQTIAIVLDDLDAPLAAATLGLRGEDGGLRSIDAVALVDGAMLFQFAVWEQGTLSVENVMVTLVGGEQALVSLLEGLDAPAAYTVLSDAVDTALYANDGSSGSTTTTVISDADGDGQLETGTYPTFNLGPDGILTVALDPGHGGTDPGAEGIGGLLEKDVNWKIAQYCKEYLEAAGVTVVLTRGENECPGLTARATTAYEAHADLYVSLHCNAADSPVHGAEVYYPTGKTSWKLEETSVPGKELAQVVLKKLVALGLTDRGVRDLILHPSEDGSQYAYPGNPNDTSDYYALIREPRQYGIPAIVVEHAYMTNASDAALLASDESLKKLAKATVDSILECYKDAKAYTPAGITYDQFIDCPEAHWVRKDGWLKYVVENGIMTGYSSRYGQLTGYFGPEDQVTRGQVATVLFRYANPDSTATTDDAASSKSKTFSDVPSGAYYTAAIEWCYEQGIVTGYGDTGTFGPDDPVTREQLAAMMYRFVKAQGGDAAVTRSAAFNAMPDVASISAYAQDPMAWCFSHGIITGDQATSPARLNPTANATRAQMAKIITVVTRDVLK